MLPWYFLLVCSSIPSPNILLCGVGRDVIEKLKQTKKCAHYFFQSLFMTIKTGLISLHVTTLPIGIPITMNGLQRTACFTKGMPNYAFSTLNSTGPYTGYLLGYTNREQIIECTSINMRSKMHYTLF